MPAADSEQITITLAVLVLFRFTFVTRRNLYPVRALAPVGVILFTNIKATVTLRESLVWVRTNDLLDQTRTGGMESNFKIHSLVTIPETKNFSRTVERHLVAHDLDHYL